MPAAPRYVKACSLGALVLFPGCLDMSTYSDDTSSSWVEPGLYHQLAEPPEGYQVRMWRSDAALGVPELPHGEGWDQPALVAIRQPRGFEIAPSYDDPAKVMIHSLSWTPIGEPTGTEEEFRAFVERALDVDEATLATIVERYRTSSNDRPEYQPPGSVLVDDPKFNVSLLMEPCERFHPDWPSCATDEFELEFMPPYRFLTKREGFGQYTLTAYPQDRTQFRYSGQAKLDEATNGSRPSLPRSDARHPRT